MKRLDANKADGGENKSSCETIVDKILSYIDKKLSSDIYQSILKKQNERWKECYPSKQKTPDIIPAAGINATKLEDRILEVVNAHYGHGNFPLAFIDKHSLTYDKYPRLAKSIYPTLDVCSHRLAKYYIPYETYTTFLPNDIEDKIKMFIKKNGKFDDFLKSIYDEHCPYRLMTREYKQYMQLDILFTAFEQKLKNQGEPHNRDAYTNLNTLLNELKKDENYFDCGYTSEDREHLEKEMYDLCLKQKKNPKFLNCCYPLTIFIFNNILAVEKCGEAKLPQRSKQAKISEGCNGMENFINAMDWVPRSLKKDDKKDKIKWLLCGMNWFFRYMCGYPHIKEIFDDYWSKIGDVKFTYNGETGEVGKEIDVICDPIFTTWLLVRYSSLFHIALMTEVADMLKTFYNIESEDDATWRRAAKEKIKDITFPNGFFTAFTFKKNALHIYQSFPQQYSSFVEQVGQEIFEKYQYLNLDDWNEILRISEAQITDISKDKKKGTDIVFGRVEALNIYNNFLKAIGLKENRVNENEEDKMGFTFTMDITEKEVKSFISYYELHRSVKRKNRDSGKG